MTMRHCTIDIGNGIIRHARNPRALDGLFKDAKTGRSIPGEDVLALARDEAEQGFEVMAPGCDNRDALGYCLGHPVEASA